MANEELQSFLNQLKTNSKKLTRIIIIVVIVVVLLNSWFTIEAEEIGVILRFGKYNRSVDPGFKMKFPYIEKLYKVPVERQLKQEFGFRTVKAGINTAYSSRSYNNESLMLTGDLNVAIVEWIVQYRVGDPYKYLFKVRNSTKTLRDVAEATMREVVGNRTVNEVLTIGRQEIANEVQKNLQDLCNQYQTGIKIEQVVLQNVTPPDKVKASFNEVNEAQQDKEKLINQAYSEYNKVVPRARGEAKQIIQQAEGYALNRVNRSKGDVARFNAIYNEYRRAPEVTRQRIYLETMNEIIPKVGVKYILDDEASGVLPLLNLDKK
ncbi:MAG: FtsH protease activity modulator HflK [Candidatus Marinimicrobia bacterium]|nr:FtsH protease activity modulator HflK [Candidatus Neomarinimicrobiota bacterium]